MAARHICKHPGEHLVDTLARVLGTHEQIADGSARGRARRRAWRKFAHLWCNVLFLKKVRL